MTVSSTEQILLHKNGTVHKDTFHDKSKTGRRKPIKTENGVLADVGVAVYNALDYGMAEDQERSLSLELESVIDKMVSSDSQDDDEGLGDEDDRTGLIEDVLEISRQHLATPSEAEDHYRAVCRALVAEAVEISFFMTKMRDQNAEDDMKEEDLKEWAGAWSHIMHQLRQGIKLKKVEFSKTPTEFALTPYEMLMDDIRSARFKLHHIDTPPTRRVNSDAREQILDFIRSRPPLKPASQRVLQPRRRKESTARELILENIRDGSGKQTLRKIERRPSKNNVLEEMKKKRRVAVIAEESPVLSSPSQGSIAARRKTSRRNSPLSAPQGQRRVSKDQTDSEDQPRMRRKTVAANSGPQNLLHDKYKTSLSFLNMTLTEMSQQRSEETRLELQDKRLPAGLLSDIMEGRTCFVCLKVSFGILHWSYTCLLCLKYVCRSCCHNISIDSNHCKVTVASVLPQLCSDTTPTPASPGVTLLR